MLRVFARCHIAIRKMTLDQPTRQGISIDSETHRKAKIRAAQLGISMKDAADLAFGLWLSQKSYGAKSQKISQK
jgi:hypothetical protein